MYRPPSFIRKIIQGFFNSDSESSLRDENIFLKTSLLPFRHCPSLIDNLQDILTSLWRKLNVWCTIKCIAFQDSQNALTGTYYPNILTGKLDIPVGYLIWDSV